MKKVAFQENVIKDLEDVKALLNQHRKVKKDLLKVGRRIKTLQKRYSFLDRLISINGCGTSLEEDLRLYFKELSIKVEKVGVKYKEEDLRVWYREKLLLIEITGDAKLQPEHTKALQVIKHIPKTQEKYPDLLVVGVFVFNHDNTRPFTVRGKKPFDRTLIEIAKSHKCSLITTANMIEAFILIKKNELSVNDFMNKLCTGGEIKIAVPE